MEVSCLAHSPLIFTHSPFSIQVQYFSPVALSIISRLLAVIFSANISFILAMPFSNIKPNFSKLFLIAKVNLSKIV